jgi:SNF2 family DNA or RNA helicase
LPNITTSTNKRQALKELLASIPLEHRDEGLLDNKAVFKAAAQFTPATSCRPDGTNGWAVKGMVSSLTHYQMLGTSFMRRQEKQQEDPRGGIVADAMGLGKTVMMIANIVNGKNLARGKGPTLVVAPAGLVHQWQGEILRHAEKNRLGKVTRYVTGHRGGQEDKEEYLKGFAIIVTTYSEICSSYPRADPPLEITDSLMKEQWWQGHYEKHKGPFHRIQFHRIILDEAQAIKNHKSITSIACRAVEATHRWAISGTPVQNTLSEFYPYFKFLHMDNTGSYKSFRANFCTEDDPAGGQRLAAMLRKVMLRRTHADMLMGVKLLELPATENTDMLVHSQCHKSTLSRKTC